MLTHGASTLVRLVHPLRLTRVSSLSMCISLCYFASTEDLTGALQVTAIELISDPRCL